MLLYKENAPWYRGNLHAHTTLSDGTLAPQEIIERYKAEGYSFLAITDHRLFYPGEEMEGFTLLGGIELDDNDVQARKAWHIIGVGVERAAPFEAGMKAPELVGAIKAAGGLAVLGHPVWSLLDHGDMMGLEGVFATEIYSSVSQAYAQRGDASEYVDTCAAHGCYRMLLGVDDVHFCTEDMFAGWIMLQAPSLRREDLLSALLAGNFYATQGGPCFRQIELNGDEIKVTCDAAQTITFFSDSFWSEKRVHQAQGALLQSAVYKVIPTDRFVRVQLTGADGKLSTSQMIPLDARQKHLL